GLFDVWSFGGFDSIVSSGLGGGSLIYANVLLRKDERWFVHEQPLPNGGYETWPVTRADLDPHYDVVERMLTPTPYPFGDAAYASTPKTRAMRRAADRLGLDWQLPPLAVSFAPKPGAPPAIGLPIVAPSYGNLHGVPRRTCELSGECDLGCNNGAKNTLDHTYLSAAKASGAQIRTLCEARTLRVRDGGGYVVEYIEHDPEHDPVRGGQRTDPDALAPRTITCDRLVLAAGTYGTTYLLLRNQRGLPGLSPALGTRFSGNGDLLTFLLPHEDQPRAFEASRGPVITSAVRVGDAADGAEGGAQGRGFYVEDGGYPGFVDWIVESANAPRTLSRTAVFLARWLVTLLRGWPNHRLGYEMSKLIGQGALTAGSLPLLGMGCDVPDGVMRLRGDLLDVEWTTETSVAFFERVRETMRVIADELGARYVDNPMWFFRRIITVHPLGGAPIGRHPGEGVCDPYGEVFGLPGLYVADGAAMPGPVGANPSLTIAAMADRACSHMLEHQHNS
ncbi:MAG: GMC family oxidoreductase, partial [Pseudonocardia sp.]|nr:GMC family oxidoreductase [Pseudonocardia sp.]